MSKTKILYDGDCYLCQQTKKMLQWLDWFHKLECMTLQAYEIKQHLSVEKKRAIQSELHIYTDSRQEKKGYIAVTYLMRKCPLTFIPGMILSIPGTGMIGRPTYRMIARNRYKIFKQKCKNGACPVPKP